MFFVHHKKDKDNLQTFYEISKWVFKNIKNYQNDIFILFKNAGIIMFLNEMISIFERERRREKIPKKYSDGQQKQQNVSFTYPFL